MSIGINPGSNLGQYPGITKWAVIHAWGEGNMVGLNFVQTLQPSITSSSAAVLANPETGLSLPAFFYVDGFRDNQYNPIIFQVTQQGNYANGGFGTGTLQCGNNDVFMPAAHPLQSMYASYGIVNSYGYTGCNVSPALSYAKAVATSLPPGTGIIIAPTMNWINGGTSLGIRSWQLTALTTFPNSATACLSYNVNHVLGNALLVPGAYLHSHVVLFGETDAIANSLLPDQVSYYFQQFLEALRTPSPSGNGNNSLAISVGQNVPIVAGNMCQAWMVANVTNGVNNSVSLSLKGISTRYRQGAFVDSFLNPSNVSAGALTSDATSASSAYYSAGSSRTYGLNLCNYGFVTIPRLPSNTVTPPITNLQLGASAATNIQGSWNPSTNASAFDFLVTIIDVPNNVVIESQASTSGVDGFTRTGLVTGRVYTVSVSAVSDWGISIPVTGTISGGNSNGVIDWSQSTLVNSSGLTPSDGTTQVVITLTLKSSNGSVIAGRNVGSISLFSDPLGVGGTNTLTAPSGTITNASGQVVYNLTNLNAVQSGGVSWGYTGLTGSPVITVLWNAINPATSSITASVPTLNADGATTTVVSVTLRNYSNALMVGYSTGPLVITNNLNVLSNPGGISVSGTTQLTSGSGVAAWTLLSANYIGGNVCVCSIANLAATATVTFTQEVAVANVDWIVRGSSATTPNTGALPTATTGNGVTAAVVSSQGTGQAVMQYTPSTINGVTKNWIDTTPIGNANNKACFGVAVGVSPSFSFSFWINIPNSVGAVTRAIVLGSTAFNATHPAAYHQLNANNVGVGNFGGYIANAFGTFITTPWPATLGMTTGSWNHVVWTYDNTVGTTGSFSGYLNGNPTPVLTTTNTGNTGNGFAPGATGTNTFITVLGGQSTSNGCMPMLIADITQYNIALTPTQVTACYNSNLVNP